MDNMRNSRREDSFLKPPTVQMFSPTPNRSRIEQENSKTLSIGKRGSSHGKAAPYSIINSASRE